MYDHDHMQLQLISNYTPILNNICVYLLCFLGSKLKKCLITKGEPIECLKGLYLFNNSFKFHGGPVTK